MIKVKVSNNNSVINKIVIEGHADYDDYGKDIVCSAVSSIVTTTVNAILTFDKSYIIYDEKKDKFVIEVFVHNEIVNNLIKNMLNMLNQIEEDYPNNIKIRKETL